VSVMYCVRCFFFFFFQAEDGIRDATVTGVQTCALPISIIYGALMALVQRDMKLLVSYSSVSHMGFIVLGIFAFNIQGQQGAVVQMVNHGIIIAALFLIVGWIGDRVGTRDRSAMAGLALRMPV